MRSMIALMVGIGVGGVGVYVVTKASPPPTEVAVPPVVAPELVACEAELAQERARASDREKGAHDHAISEPISSSVPGQSDSQQAENNRRISDQRAVSWQISAIEKFVPLSEEQKIKLQEKFLEERAARRDGRESGTEPLEAIIGEESASTYRRQVQAAFERVQDMELEKETVWISRQLSLSEQQERDMRTMFLEVEARLKTEFGGGDTHNELSGQERVTRLIAENKKRRELRAAGTQKILNEEQRKRYAEQEAQSSSADMEVFHDSGE